MRTLLLICLLALLICLPCFAQPSMIATFSVSDDITKVYNPWNISFPSGSVTNNGNGTVSISLPGLVTALCTSSTMNCIYSTLADCPTPDHCFVYEDSVVKLYVNNVLQSNWPDTGAFYYLLIDATHYLLIDATHKLRIQ